MSERRLSVCKAFPHGEDLCLRCGPPCFGAEEGRLTLLGGARLPGEFLLGSRQGLSRLHGQEARALEAVRCRGHLLVQKHPHGRHARLIRLNLGRGERRIDPGLPCDALPVVTGLGLLRGRSLVLLRSGFCGGGQLAPARVEPVGLGSGQGAASLGGPERRVRLGVFGFEGIGEAGCGVLEASTHGAGFPLPKSTSSFGKSVESFQGLSAGSGRLERGLGGNEGRSGLLGLCSHGRMGVLGGLGCVRPLQGQRLGRHKMGPGIAEALGDGVLRVDRSPGRTQSRLDFRLCGGFGRGERRRGKRRRSGRRLRRLGEGVQERQELRTHPCDQGADQRGGAGWDLPKGPPRVPEFGLPNREGVGCCGSRQVQGGASGLALIPLLRGEGVGGPGFHPRGEGGLKRLSPGPRPIEAPPDRTRGLFHFRLLSAGLLKRLR